MKSVEEKFGWKLAREKTPYFVPPIELTEREDEILSQLLQLLLREPSRGLHSLLRALCEEKNIILEKASGEKIIGIAKNCVEGLGVLDFLLADDELEEISVIGVGKPVFVFHRKKGWLETNAFFTSEEHAVNAVNKIARPLGRRVTLKNPRLNAVLPDGSRLHASIPPVCLDGVELSIRKFLRNPLNARELADFGTVSVDALAFLWTVLYGDVSLCIAGNTGSGKTTTLNALFSFVPLNERIIVAEETPELFLLQKHVVKMIASEDAGASLKDLVRDTLRMRPDRVVVGEVRSKAEAEGLLDSLLAGQAKGSFFTFHSKSSLDVMSRLKAFGVDEGDLDAVDLVLVQKRISFFDLKAKKAREMRKVTEIAEVKNSKPRFLFSLDASGVLNECKGLKCSAVAEKTLQNYGFSLREFWREVARRKSFLKKTRFAGFKDFTLKAQEFAFGLGAEWL
ncbi:MAG: ATPase, T2SS/T4P/T4SS family [Candidatus Norongarragalinales archaeon]